MNESCIAAILGDSPKSQYQHRWVTATLTLLDEYRFGSEDSDKPNPLRASIQESEMQPKPSRVVSIAFCVGDLVKSHRVQQEAEYSSNVSDAIA